MSSPAKPGEASPPTSGPPFVFPKDGRRPYAGPLYVARDDRLYVRTRGSVAGKQVELRLRLQMPDGQVVPQLQTLAITGDRTTQVQVFDLAEGYLLGVAVQVVPAPVLHGAVYVEVGITHESVPTLAVYQVLVAGYVSDGDALGWPYGRPVGPLEGPGNLRSIAGAAPAAGAEIVTAVPANATWRLLSWRAQLVTAIAVANRRVHLVVDDGATILQDLASADTEVASLARNYNAAADGFPRVAQDSEVYIPLPAGLVLRSGFRIRTLTTAIQAADQWGAPQLFVEEYLEP